MSWNDLRPFGIDMECERIRNMGDCYPLTVNLGGGFGHPDGTGPSCLKNVDGVSDAVVDANALWYVGVMYLL